MKFGELHKQAKDSGALGGVLPDGDDFTIEVIGVNATAGTDGKPDRFGMQVEVVDAPDADVIGQKSWFNFNFSEKAAAISFRQLRDFGVEDEDVQATETVDDLANAMKGVKFKATVGHRVSGANGEYVNNTFKNVEVLVSPSFVVDAESSEDEEPY